MLAFLINNVDSTCHHSLFEIDGVFVNDDDDYYRAEERLKQNMGVACEANLKGNFDKSGVPVENDKDGKMVIFLQLLSNIF